MNKNEEKKLEGLKAKIIVIDEFTGEEFKVKQDSYGVKYVEKNGRCFCV